MKIQNLTPHPFSLISEGKEVLNIPSSGVLRIPEEYRETEAVGSIPVVKKKLKVLDKLPEAEPDTIYIVSLPVLMALAAAGIQRADMFCPETGKYAVRDSNGRIVGTTRLCQLGDD